MNPLRSRLSKAFAFSICMHLFVLASLGFAARFEVTPKDEGVFDVALMDAPADIDSTEIEEQEQTETSDVKEDDIVEERREIPKPKPKKSTNKPKGPIRKAGGTGSGLGQGTTPGNSSTGVAAPTVPPRIKKYSEPHYPSSVKNAGITGVVKLRVLIDKNGNPESVSVSSSSGNGELDNSALNTAYKWRFSPGLDNLGKPVRCYAYIPVRFDIK